jgi:hypothetical protein
MIKKDEKLSEGLERRTAMRSTEGKKSREQAFGVQLTTYSLP